MTAAPVTIDPEELKQHAAFLGASGSGKTTAALTLIEQLLARGIPVVILDRKGDLCRYADPSAWQRPLADPRDAAQRQPATKAPMEGLLKRARSAGVALMLATQSPGDFDYKCRDNIRTWLVGRVRETTALNKLRPMFTEARVDVAAKLPAQETGQFHLVREKEGRPVQAAASLIVTEQLPEERILELARVNRT